ncbi:Acetyltransferase (GNAT) domain-containing protein [Caloranaerobacter azorensis DSM 13643]|uniref:Acetyltransferase (GNAT) domain-containing protein n=1 Tax=Caloranaerobacter azorensis DSM 13643 TaxID=1121264 RepID=A0A1M5TC71_9FIRM|nr:GNAT family N-acetyltransferase [Caloranaerobacter azorensis]SHH47943.1 Acetyltransferase (GNAT) domain-containing protein [Caloranaerobacter azorensis DSM 13643]
MISAKKINKREELAEVNKLLVKNGFQEETDLSQIIYVMKENEEFIGVAKITVIENIGVLNYLVIDSDRRGEDLGDSLLRAILNYCDLNFIKKIYYPYENSYLQKKGFKSADIDEKEFLKVNNINSDKLIVCNTEEFFRDGCCQMRRGC